jgi:hypothetical protein
LLFKFFKDILKKIYYYPAKKVKADLKGQLYLNCVANRCPFWAGGFIVLLRIKFAGG